MASEYMKRCPTPLVIKENPHNELPPHTHQHGCHQKGEQVLVRTWAPRSLLVGKSNPQPLWKKLKHRAAI